MNVVENKIDIIILAMGGADMLRRKDLMGMMSFGGRRHFRIFYLTPAIKKGLVRMAYPEHPNRPDQAYFLTKEGLERLEELKRDQVRIQSKGTK